MKKNQSLENKILTAILILTASSLLLTACQKSPDSSIVVNKDMDKLIKQAETLPESDEKESSVLKEIYNTYKTTIEDEKLHVKVNVDAQVDIPETDQMSVFRVSQKKISQELLDAVRLELMGNTQLYNGTVLKRLTKKELEKSIANVKGELNQPIPEDDYEKNKRGHEEMEQRLKELEAAYEFASTDISFENQESDGKFHEITEKYEEDQGDIFYSWLHMLTSGEGETFYGVSDGSNGNYSELYALNSENRANYLSFATGKYGFQKLGMYGFEPSPDYIGSGIPAEIDETGILKKEEAIEIADTFLKKVGINNDTDEFRYYEGEMKTEKIYLIDKSIAEGGKEVTRKCYVLKYMRYIDGAFVTLGGQMKTNRTEGEKGGTYVKKDWPTEEITFRVDDSGIVGFTYTAPLQIKESIVEKSAMQPYDQIQKTFEKMIVIINGEESTLENTVTRQLDIDRVKLGYIMVSEPDSYDTGILVPAWDFFGVNSLVENGSIIHQELYQPCLTINAIDGSVIDRTLGY